MSGTVYEFPARTARRCDVCGDRWDDDDIVIEAGHVVHARCSAAAIITAAVDAAFDRLA